MIGPRLRLFPGALFLVVGVLGPMVRADAPEPRAPDQATASTGVSTNDCLTCHEDKAFTNAFKHSKHAGLEQACASCHAGANEHAKAQMEGTAKGPGPSLKALKAADVNVTCLECHDKGRQASFHGGMHERRNLSCISCHSVHAYKSDKAQLKTARDSETCFTCHQAIRAKTMRTSHHPVREGRLECASCHDPHDSTSPKMVSATWVNEKCLECHTEKRGPFLWEHAPVRENCLNCHDPHGSNHDKMLVAKLPFLCQRCHLSTRHPGTLYDGVNAVAGGNLSNRAVEHACKNCHQNVHGSNAPSAPYMGR